MIWLGLLASSCSLYHPMTGVWPDEPEEDGLAPEWFLAGLSGSLAGALGGNNAPNVPQSLSNLIVYFQAHSYSLPNGTPVSMLSNESGAPYPFSSTNWPLFQSNSMNGHPALDFSTHHITVDLTGMNYNGYTLIMVVTNGTAQGTGVVEHRNGSTIGSWSILQCSLAWGCAAGSFRFEAEPGVLQHSGVWNTQTRVMSIVNIPGVDWRAYCGGMAVASHGGPVPANNNGPLTIGERYNYTSPFVGQIGELALYNRALPDEERMAVENHLLNRYGLTPTNCGL